MAVQGRWTIYACACGATADGTTPERLIHRGNCVFGRFKPQVVEVVPVNDTAIERVARVLLEQSNWHWSWNACEADEKAPFLKRAEAVLRAAAGERS